MSILDAWDENGRLKLFDYGFSPTAINTYFRDKYNFYKRYILKEKSEQTLPMAIGSAFDTIVKNYISDRLFGIGDKFDFSNVGIPEAIERGEQAFKLYLDSGSMTSMMLELSKAVTEPRMELTVEEVFDGIKLMGKPDIYFIGQTGNYIVYDWKVTGKTSPFKYYVYCNPSNKEYKETELGYYNGLVVNISQGLEEVSEDWALQTTIYSWVLGESIGAKFIVGIDQILRDVDRVARYRNFVSPEYQQKLWDNIRKMRDELEVLTPEKFAELLRFYARDGE